MSGPWRRDFDAARDPYTARNALGILPPVVGAPTSAQYITAATDPALTAERVLTNTATITWDFTTPGQAKASAVGGGNVSNSGTPTVGQYAKWVTATTIQGVAPATVLSDIGAQPLDADLTSLAAASATNALYYRSAANTWGPVTIGANLTFSGGTLAAAASSGIATVAIQKFTASGTYTPTAGMKYCIIEAVGGGAGGGAVPGGGSSVYYSGGGGGSGGYSRHRATAAEIGASQTVTIGSAGIGGIAGTNDGTPGSDTSIGTLCIAKGGGGGKTCNPGTATSIGQGGPGGVAGTGNVLTAAGNPGGNGVFSQVTAVTASGFGGSSFFGGGAAGTYTVSSPATGLNAGNYGAGGSGGMSANSTSAASGGNGSAGFVVITEYI